jgi:4-oxalocrotonate tautomerase
MPYVNIKVTRERGGPTAEQKKELIVRTTRMLQEVLDKDPATTFVIIDEVETDNWGIGYDNVTTLRANAAAAKAKT